MKKQGSLKQILEDMLMIIIQYIFFSNTIKQTHSLARHGKLRKGNHKFSFYKQSFIKRQ